MDFRFDVAISYAGSDREVAGAIARIAVANGLRVFYDEYYVSELWGRNLLESLADIYDRQARFCLILVSRDYCDRPYTIDERRIALDRAIASRTEYILPVVTDDAWLDGLPRSTAFLDLRKMTVIEVAGILVRKVKGDSHAEVLVPDDPESHKVVPATAIDSGNAEHDGVRFVAIRLGDEVRDWQERATLTLKGHPASIHQGFAGPLDGDPLFDVTIMNRSGEPVLLLAVGIQFLSVECEELGMGGAMAGVEVERTRTFYVELPDLWARLAEAARQAGSPMSGPLAVQEVAMSRLPNPVYLDADTPYRYGLELFDYQRLVPNRAVTQFWIKTDRAEYCSHRVFLSYLIPGAYGAINRYSHLLGQSDRDENVRRRAYRLWNEGGSPEGRGLEFWLRAERDVAEEESPRAWPVGEENFAALTALRPRPL